MTFRRFLIGLTLAMALAWQAMTWMPVIRAQEDPGGQSLVGDDPFAGWAKLLDRGFTFDPDADQAENYKVTTSPEARFLASEAVRQIEAADYAEALRTLQRLIDDFPNHLIEVGRAQFLGAGELARFLLRGLPPAGRAAYDAFVRRRDPALLERVRGKRDGGRPAVGGVPAALRDVATRYDLSSEGRSALVALVEQAFEEGRFEIAEAYARRALQSLDGLPAGDQGALRAVLVGRLALARRERGLPLQPLVPLVDEGARVVLQGEGCDLAALLRDSGDGTADGPLAARSWPTFCGAEDRNRSARAPERLPDLAEPAYALAIFDRLPGQIDPFEISRPLDRGVIPPYQPARVGDTLFVNNGLGVWAANLYSGEKLWTYEGPLMDIDPVRQTGLEQFGRIHPCPISNNYLTGITVVDRLVLANVLRPVPWRRPHRLDNHVINTPLPARSLVALRASDGELEWRSDTVQGPGSDLLARLSIPSLPAVIGDLVVAFGYYREGGINAYLVVLDLGTGRLLQSMPLCISQSELTMFGRPFREFTAAPVAAFDDCVYVCTNLGLLSAVDVNTGWVRWMSAYRTIPIQPATNFLRPNPRRVVWANNPPIVDEERVYIAPHDSDYLFAFDRRTGSGLWSVRARGSGHGELRHLLGVRGGRVFVSGSQEVAAYDAHTGQVIWRRLLDRAKGQMPSGRGVLTDDEILIPTVGELLRLAQQNGQVRSGRIWATGAQRSLAHQSGNTLVFADLLVTAGPKELAVYLDVERALREVEQRLRSSHPAFADLVTAANLLCYRRDFAGALDYYRQALAVAKERGVSPVALTEVHHGIRRSSIERCRTLCPVDADGAFAMLEQARRYTDSNDADMTACLSLLGNLATTRDRERFLALIEDLDRRYGSETWEAAPSGPVSVGLFLLITRADFHQLIGGYAEEVTALQQAVQRFGDRGWHGRTVREVAFERIQERLRSAGRDIYAALDRQAEQLVREAIERDDPDALLYAIQAFPNAKRIGRYVVQLGDLLAEHGRYADLFTQLPSFLRNYPGAPEAKQILSLLVHSAEAVGNLDLAATIRAEAGRSGIAVEAGPSGERRAGGPDVLSGREDRSGVGALAPAAGEGRLEERYTWETGTSRSRVTEMCGLRLGAGRSVAVLVTSRHVLALDLEVDDPAAAVLWERSGTSDPRDPIPVPLAVGESLVVATRSVMRGLEPLTGTERWRRAFDPPVVVSTVESGLIVAVTDSREDELPCRLWAVEPSTGAVLWSRDLGERWPTFLEVDGPVAGVPRRATRSLDLFATLTGETVASGIPMSFDAYSAPEIFAEFGIVLTPARERRGGGVRADQIWDKLLAYDLRSAPVSGGLSTLWQRRGLQGSVRRRDVFRYGDSVGVLYQPSTGEGPVLWLLDPRTGEPRRDLLRLPRGSELVGMERGGSADQPLLLARLGPTASRFQAPLLREPLQLAAVDPLGNDASGEAPLWSVEVDLGRCQLMRRLEATRVGERIVLLANVIPNGQERCDTHLFVLDSRTGARLSHEEIRGSESWHKGVIKRAGSSLFVLKGPRRLVVYDLR